MNKTCNKYLWFYQKYFNVWSYDRPIRGRKSILKIRNVPERENICDCCAYKSLGIPILKKGFLLFHSLWISPLSKRCPLRRSLDKRASITRVFYPLIKIYDHHRPPDIFRCVPPPSLPSFIPPRGSCWIPRHQAALYGDTRVRDIDTIFFEN